MSAFGGKSGRADCNAKCLLLIQSGHAKATKQQFVNVQAQWQRKRVYWLLASGPTDFDLDSINLGKHILIRQDLRSAYVARIG
jgi:hypothetical protein